MSDRAVIAYNVAALLCALFVLEQGADVFIDHTAIVAKRTGIPQPVIALLTAGAEWEELAVVVICLTRDRPALALGNVVGSAISNILGAFSLGLVFRKGSVDMFDQSSRIYTAALAMVTVVVSGLLAFAHGISWRAAGGTLVGVFGLYIASISYLIARGFSTAPEEMSDSESDSDSDSSGSEPEEDADRRRTRGSTSQPHLKHAQSTTPALETDPLLGQPANGSSPVNPSESFPPTSHGSDSPARSPRRVRPTVRTPRGLAYHVAMLVLGFTAVILSSYVLSNAAANLVDQTGVSDLVFGAVILSIATTLPEKFIAIMSGYKGHMGIMVANTVGSNIFLLTLCLGIIWLVTDGDYHGQALAPAEIAVVLGSTVALASTVLVGGQSARVIGVAMFIGYIAFIVLEFTVIHGLGGEEGESGGRWGEMGGDGGEGGRGGDSKISFRQL